MLAVCSRYGLFLALCSYSTQESKTRFFFSTKKKLSSCWDLGINSNSTTLKNQAVLLCNVVNFLLLIFVVPLLFEASRQLTQ